MATQTFSPASSVVERYRNASSTQFEQQVEKSWQALEEIKGQVEQLVRNEQLTPIEGIGIMACTSAQVFGYAAFHGQPTTADLLSGLTPSRQ